MQKTPTQELRDKVFGWLLRAGYKAQIISDPKSLWVISAELQPGLGVGISQLAEVPDAIMMASLIAIGPEYQAQLALLSTHERRALVWDIYSKLLTLSVHFGHISDPLQDITIERRLYLDALTQDALFERMEEVLRAMLIVHSVLDQKFGREVPSSNTYVN